MELSEAVEKDLKRGQRFEESGDTLRCLPVQEKNSAYKQFDQITQQVKQQRPEELQATGMWMCG